MRALASSLIVLALLFGVGCDSGSDESSDVERFLGTWQAVSVKDSAGDKTAEFQTEINSVVVLLRTDNTYRLDVDYRESSNQADVTLEGDYSLQADGQALLLDIGFGGSVIQVEMIYRFVNDQTVELEGDALLVNAVVGSDLFTGRVTLTIARVTT